MTVLKLINNSEFREEKNLCFVNTSLQLLYSIKDVRDFFKDKVYQTDLAERLPVSDEISRIFKTEGKCRTSAAELRRLIGQYHRREDICNGSQQDMQEFTTLLLDCIEQELKSVNEHKSKFINKFTGTELNRKVFKNTRDGACQKGHKFRSEPEIFRTIKLSVPDTDSELSLNNMIHNHYCMKSESIMMKCSACCQHPSNCPQTNMCELKEAAEEKCLLSAPTFLYIQLLRFFDIHRKIKTKVVPENVLVLPNADKYKLVSIGNHLGTLPTNGHYQALVKSGATSWLLANDDNNYKTNIQDHINADNYILLYKKFSTKSPKVPYDSLENAKSIELETQKCVKNKDIHKIKFESTSTQHKPELGLLQEPINRNTQRKKIGKNEEDAENQSVGESMREKQQSMDATLIQDYDKNIQCFTFENFGVEVIVETLGKMVTCLSCLEMFTRMDLHLKKSWKCCENIDVDKFWIAYKVHQKERQKLMNKLKCQKYSDKERLKNPQLFMERTRKRKRDQREQARTENPELFREKERKRKKVQTDRARSEDNELVKQSQKQRVKMHTDKARLENNELFKQSQRNRKKIQTDRARLKDNELVKQNLRERQKLSRLSRKKRKDTLKISHLERLKYFKNAIKFGAIFICSCCNQRLFQNAVTVITENFRQSIEAKKMGLYNLAVEEIEQSINGKKASYLCHTCKGALQRGKLPSMSVGNGLMLRKLCDPELKLSEIENSLIAQNIIFQKIFLLPKSRMSAVKDRLVNVPIEAGDVINTVKNIPRTPKEAGLIQVKLK